MKNEGGIDYCANPTGQIDREQGCFMRKSVCPTNDSWNSVRKSPVTFSMAVSWFSKHVGYSTTLCVCRGVCAG